MALILVADDDNDIRDLIRLRLTAWGHEVIAVPDGEAVLEALRQHPVDVAMVDLSMPRMSGIDVVTTIRAQEALQLSGRLPIIVMSARCSPVAVAEAFTAGADEVLVKPFRLNTLVQVVSAMVPAAEPAMRARYSA